jgi:hypothetical protein
LKANEEKARKDYAEAQTKLNALVEEKTQLLTAKKTLEEQVEKLNSQLTQLTTHSNHKQKIRHHVKVKQDYDELRKINETLAHELRRKELLVRRLTSELIKRKSDSMRSPKCIVGLSTSQRIALEREIENAALMSIDEEETLRRLLRDKEAENQELTENLWVSPSSIHIHNTLTHIIHFKEASQSYLNSLFSIHFHQRNRILVEFTLQNF